ncbi:hypothetical protein EV182_001968 [Spiromyces aspiralis]|uniref:Uncharacterized protein n=1 Tax=Spiromyces aspiralis TaxID=68401 RepID=A0ACC1HMD9_9FUNG|nr:hypothetical protein EV182_001968 [Spiromyces aspiralis]
MLKHHWLLCIYAVLLLSAMSYIAHISPDEFRSTFPGISFQLANLISSPSVLILAKAGESNRMPDGRSNYA